MTYCHVPHDEVANFEDRDVTLNQPAAKFRCLR
jgi:hypothetical protein